MKWLWVALVAFMMAAGWEGRARAESTPDPLTISLLTFGPGDHAFSKFGHTGLLVEDRERGTSVVYNYGTFAFDSIGLIPKFLLGKYRYWLSVQSFSHTVADYEAQNRSVLAQELRLTAEQKRSMVAFLEWNARDENKFYVFDYYRDNCATRVRDLVDRASRGALARVSTNPADLTWRGHTERLSAEDVPVYLGLYLAMGSFIDRPITQWEEMFLPAKLAEGMERAGIVGRERVLVAAKRAPPRLAPPNWTGQALLLGAAMGGLLAYLGKLAGRGVENARTSLRVALGVFGVAAGLLGVLFLFLWIVTNHEVAYHNENLLPFAPFALLFARKGTNAAGLRIALALVACSTIGLLLKALPWFSQDNGLVLAFALPLWTGAASAIYFADRTRASRLPESRETSNDDKSSRGDNDDAPVASPSASASEATSAPAEAPSRR